MSRPTPTPATLDDWVAREAIAFAVDSPGAFHAAIDRVMASLGDRVELHVLGQGLHGFAIDGDVDQPRAKPPARIFHGDFFQRQRNAAFRAISSIGSFAIYTHVIRRKVAPSLPSAFTDPFMQRLDHVYQARISKNEMEPKTPEERFFREIKGRTVHAYYSSKIGIHQEMEYKGNVPIKEFVGIDVSSSS